MSFSSCKSLTVTNGDCVWVVLKLGVELEVQESELEEQAVCGHSIKILADIQCLSKSNEFPNNERDFLYGLQTVFTSHAVVK